MRWLCAPFFWQQALRSQKTFMKPSGFQNFDLLPSLANVLWNFENDRKCCIRQGTMYHMHWVHMVVMDVVLHIDRHWSRHRNFHGNLYNMRYDGHILFLATQTIVTTVTMSRQVYLLNFVSYQDQFHFIVHLCTSCVASNKILHFVASSWHSRLAWTQHHSCFSRDHCECHWLKP